MSTSLEIGQLVFGNPWGDHACPHWCDALVREILEQIDRVFWNRNQREWDKQEDPGIAGITYNPYYWGNDEDQAARANLAHGSVEVRWYKYPKDMAGAALVLRVEQCCLQLAREIKSFDFVGWVGTTVYGVLESVLEAGYIVSTVPKPCDSHDWSRAVFSLTLRGEHFLALAEQDVPELVGMLNSACRIALNYT